MFPEALRAEGRSQIPDRIAQRSGAASALTTRSVRRACIRGHFGRVSVIDRRLLLSVLGPCRRSMGAWHCPETSGIRLARAARALGRQQPTRSPHPWFSMFAPVRIPASRGRRADHARELVESIAVHVFSGLRIASACLDSRWPNPTQGGFWCGDGSLPGKVEEWLVRRAILATGHGCERAGLRFEL